jgi:hypothetical protein
MVKERGRRPRMGESPMSQQGSISQNTTAPNFLHYFCPGTLAIAFAVTAIAPEAKAAAAGYGIVYKTEYWDYFDEASCYADYSNVVNACNNIQSWAGSFCASFSNCTGIAPGKYVGSFQSDCILGYNSCTVACWCGGIGIVGNK